MATDWANIRKYAFSTDKAPSEWPTGVRPISIGGLNLLGIGPDNRLYWDGQALRIERRLSLNWWQSLLATIAAFGTAANGTIAVLKYFQT